MEGMSSNLGRLLKQTRLSAHHPSQVYTAPAAFLARGDFGLKKALPLPREPSTSKRPSDALGRLRYLQVSQQETADGQTEWRENERDPLFQRRWSEKNARLTGFVETAARENGSLSERPRDSLGPRIRTVFDSATYRLLPSDVPLHAGPLRRKATAKERAQHAAQQAQYEELRKRAHVGAFTPPGLEDPFGSAATSYSSHLDLFPDYGTMSPKQFDKFLRGVRKARGAVKEQLQRSMQDAVRSAIVNEARRARENALQLAKDAESRGATPPVVPQAVEPKDVELPRITADLWDEARTLTGTDVTRKLKERHLRRVSRPSNQDLGQPTHGARVHPSAGLQYSQPDEIFTQRLSESLPGRVIVQPLSLGRKQQTSSFGRRNADLGVASGGHIEQVPSAVRANLQPYDPAYSSQVRAESNFRVISATMESQVWKTGRVPPEAEQSSQLGYIQAKVRPSNETSEDVPLPGSTAFVGANDRVKVIQPRASPVITQYQQLYDSSAPTPSQPAMPPDALADNLGRAGVQSMLQGVGRTLSRNRS